MYFGVGWRHLRTKEGIGNDLLDFLKVSQQIAFKFMFKFLRSSSSSNMVYSQIFLGKCS